MITNKMFYVSEFLQHCELNIEEVMIVLIQS